MNDNNEKSLARQHTILTVLSVVLGIMLVLVIVAAVNYGCRMDQEQQPEPQVQAPPETTETVPPLPMFTVPEISAAEVDFGTGPQIETVAEDTVKILLIGQDSDAETGARSDTILLCAFNKEKNTIAMVSFLRDTYVRIPGYGKDRLNAAYSVGGAQLLEKTLYENFGLEIDGNIRVDFSHFSEIIDSLGGVIMELTAAEADFINKNVPDSNLKEGKVRLDGEQALMYARNRHDVDGDFSRTNRQRKLIRVLIDTYKSKSLPEMLRLMNEILPMISTDISKKDLIAYAVAVFPMLTDAEIKTEHIPISGGYYPDKINEKSVLVPYMNKNKQALADLLG